MRLFPFFLLFLLSSCIQDDIIADEVEPELRLTQLVDTIGINDTFQFEATFFNNVGQEEPVNITWESLDTDIVSISPSGLATGLQNGSTTLTARYESTDGSWFNSTEVSVAEETIIPVVQSRSGVIETTSFYVLEGEFEITTTDEGLAIEIADNFRASTTLPGLYVYLANNPNTLSGALEIGPVETFNGSHSYEVFGADINDYNYLLYFCKPFNVKVGDGEIQ